MSRALETINELELRKFLKAKIAGQELVSKILRRLVDPSLSWEEKRPFWNFLFNTGREDTLCAALSLTLESKQRIPFDLYIAMCARANLQPNKSILESLIKGLKKQKAHEDILACKGWDKWDPRFGRARAELLEQKLREQRQQKENLKEKFHFLKNQRMTEQAGRVLRRMLELYPDDGELKAFKSEFDEQWARDVLSTHISTLQSEGMDRTQTEPSSGDKEMIQRLMIEGEKISFEHRAFAFDLAVAFWFMEDYNHALDILAWAEIGSSSDWMRAELLFASRRFLEALEHLNQMEIKYIEDPETTFSVSYLRAQCLWALGQKTLGLEIMQSIVRVRSNYRSAHALILKWAEGVSWE